MSWDEAFSRRYGEWSAQMTADIAFYVKRAACRRKRRTTDHGRGWRSHGRQRAFGGFSTGGGPATGVSR